MAQKIKVVEKIEPNPIEELNQEEREDYFTKLVLGKDVTTDVETERGTFTIKYPTPDDELIIGRWMAWYRNYNPIDSFDVPTNNLIVITATLDVLVVSGPAWYERAKQSVKNFRWNKIPDQKLARELYQAIQTFRTTIEESFSTNGGTTTLGVPTPASAPAALAGGVFEGMSK
jgi:hypothetical protein